MPAKRGSGQACRRLPLGPVHRPYTRLVAPDPSPPAAHLVRHGEVNDPDHVVYAALPGYRLSELGKRQAAATAVRLSPRRVQLVVSSPLERAMETAEVIARPHRLQVETDDRLAEWALGRRWSGTPWDDLPALFPGELEAYRAHPDRLPFSPESLTDLARRVAAAVADAWERRGEGDVVVVGHQDPLEAGRRRLTGRSFAGFHVDKPTHAGVITLVPGSGRWMEQSRWDPPRAPTSQL